MPTVRRHDKAIIDAFRAVSKKAIAIKQENNGTSHKQLLTGHHSTGFLRTSRIEPALRQDALSAFENFTEET